MFRVNGRTLATGGNNQYKQQQKPATWFAPKGYMVKYGYFLLEVVYYPFLFLNKIYARILVLYKLLKNQLP